MNESNFFPALAINLLKERARRQGFPCKQRLPDEPLST